MSTILMDILLLIKFAVPVQLTAVSPEATWKMITPTQSLKSTSELFVNYIWLKRNII